MGKKIWLSKHPRNFGSEKIVCSTNVRPYVRSSGNVRHVSWDEVLHFKYARVSAVNRIATRTFTNKKQQQQQSRSFLSLNFNVYLDVDTSERAKATNKK